MLRKTLTTLAAALATTVALAAPAHAEPNPPYTPTTIYAYGTSAGVFLGGLQINSTCEAHVEGLVAAVVIEKCVIRYYDGSEDSNHPGAAPGNAVASNFTQRVYTLDWDLCWSAYTIPLHDPTQKISTEGCAYQLLPGADGVTFGHSQTTA